jgi:hypothetical protein
MSERDSGTGSANADSGLLMPWPGQTAGQYRIVSASRLGRLRHHSPRAMDTELDLEVSIKEYPSASLAVRHHGARPRFQYIFEYFFRRCNRATTGRMLTSLHRPPRIVLVHGFLEANGTTRLELHGGRQADAARAAAPLWAEDESGTGWKARRPGDFGSKRPTARPPKPRRRFFASGRPTVNAFASRSPPWVEWLRCRCPDAVSIGSI